MHPLFRRLTLILICLALATAPAQTPASFAGSWTLNPDLAKLRKASIVLHIEQTATTLRITREDKGKTTVSTYPLDGTDGVYTAPTGLAGKGHVTRGGDDLLIDTFVTTTTDGDTIRFHTHEKWSLTLGGKVLTVHVETDSPDIPPALLATIVKPFDLIFDRAH
jgi:hypothetical protein